MGHRTSRGSRGRTLPGRDGKAGYVVRPVPRNRQVVLDALTGAARRFPVHGLVEFDVRQASSRLAEAAATGVLDRLRDRDYGPGGRLHPEVNARRAGNRVLFFDRIDVVVLPDPFGPSTASTLPWAAARSTRSSASVAP
jgi:hypothetical protein